MKAAYVEAPGAPDVIHYGELPTPTPQAGEVRIRVGAAALNPIDMYVRAGTVKMPLPLPFISGSDVAGTIDAVGPGVKRFKVGDRVWGSNQGLLGRQGSSAEFVCASEEFFYPTPAGVSDDEAAAVALVGITAHVGLFQRAKLQAGETVFVNGGTGGVGSMVVQMAKAVGAKAITTVGSEEKAKLCRSWGVDCVLNYKTDDVPARIKDFTQGQGVNVWYETQREPDFFKMVDSMARNGRMIVMAGRTAQPTFPVGPFYVKGLALLGFAMFFVSTEEQRVCADDINRWLSAKKLHIVIGRTFKIAAAAASHQFLEDNTLQKAGTLTGKVVLHP
jgi:NADPH:quinone reductase